MLATAALSRRRSLVLPSDDAEEFYPSIEGICTNSDCRHQRNSIDCYGCDPIARTCCKCHSPLSSGSGTRTFRPPSRASSIGSAATGPSVPPGSKKHWPDNLRADWPDTDKNDNLRRWALHQNDSIASPDRAGATSPWISPQVESQRSWSISDLFALHGDTTEIPDNIAKFMEGPSQLDNKWMCKYPDCVKRFGRKENLKSHIQTHLADRPHRCTSCSKCFVRLYDLRRHAKVHENPNPKPYGCLCGTSFSRTDLLARHRMRGTCIGSWDKVTRTVKRGRPRHTLSEPPENAKRARVHGQADRRRAASASSAANTSATDQIEPQTSLLRTRPMSSCDLSSWSISFTPLPSPTFSTGNAPSPPLSPRLRQNPWQGLPRESTSQCKIVGSPKSFEAPGSSQ